MEIFDTDDITIPNEGIHYNNYFWIHEYSTQLDMIDEIWMPIDIMGKIILVSNMGRVQNNLRKTLGSGYKSINIKGHPFLVHRLVITAFQGNYDPKLVVNHKDRDRSNNRLDNLELVTPSENIIHAINSGHKSLKSVQQISKDGSLIATFPSIQKASDATGIGHSSIGKAANGKQKNAGGFI